ncbi:hypothetical protein SDC9_138821 [bioreactor metagenome]|uniref:2-isopropylmalate synthase LeuA allosteric (dimerisation) domain-containing protein n=1 Tax=bioreactor metagenome TaxID=1076179 RepID=A0A645DR08_9ZZZZ|nr:hypothetical protein [Lutispora sp.]MEA4963341.1 hypothetical protein [Lutispora sp.]
MDDNKIALEEEIKSLVCRIPDVLSCKVILGDKNEVEDIHVLCSTGRNIKQLVRDIQSAVSARFNMEIDYKVISVAQIEENEYKDNRLKIDSISMMNMDNSLKATVVLENEEKTFEGVSIKVKSTTNKYKAVAEATILALEAFINTNSIFYLEGIEKTKIAGRDAFLCLVGYTYKNTENLLIGSSLIKTDENEAVVKSALNALNRMISKIV